MFFLIILNKFKLIPVILWKHLLPEFGELYRKGNFTRAISYSHELVSWQISLLGGGEASQNVKICKRFNIHDRWDPQFIPSCVYSPSASCLTFFRNSMRLAEIQIQRRDIRCNSPNKYLWDILRPILRECANWINSQLAEKCADNQIFCDRWASPFIPVVFAALFANASQPKPHQADEITEKRFRR